jgi:O-antigen ligase
MSATDFHIKKHRDWARALSGRLVYGLVISFLIILVIFLILAPKVVDPILLPLLLVGLPIIALVIWRWEVGVFLVVALLPFESSFIVGGFRDGMKLLAAITFMALLLKAVRNTSVWERLVKVLHHKLTLMLLILLIWSFSSVLWASDTSFAVQRSITFLGVLLLFIMVAVFKDRQLKRLWLVGIFMGVVSIIVSVITTGGTIGRFTAASEDPNEFAGLILILAAFLSYGEVYWRLGFLRWILVAVLLLGALFSQSRTGLIALAAAPLASAIFLTFSGTRVLAKTLLPYALLVITVAGVFTAWPELTAPLVERYSTLSDYQSADTWAGRLGIWEGGLQMVAQHPLLGVGAGNFAILSPDYSFAAANLNFLRPNGAVAHNMFLSMLAELGAIGLVLFIMVLAKGIKIAYVISRETSLGTACFVSLFIYFVMGSTLSWEYSKLPYLLLGSIVALALSERNYLVKK